MILKNIVIYVLCFINFMILEKLNFIGIEENQLKNSEKFVYLLRERDEKEIERNIIIIITYLMKKELKIKKED